MSGFVMTGMNGLSRRARWLSGRLGLDGNPLRRRTDKLAVCLGAQLLAVLLIGAPLLGVAAFNWVGHTGAAAQRAERAWREVPAVLLRTAPAPDSFAGGVFGYSWAPARWTAPDGHVRHGEIPVTEGLAAGRSVPLWVDFTGLPTGIPLTHRAVEVRAVTAAATAVVALVFALALVGWAGRWLLDRRRLSDWELDWAVVGPQWTRRFRSLG